MKDSASSWNESLPPTRVVLRIRQTPGIGPVVATAIIAAIVDGAAFRKGRDFVVRGKAATYPARQGRESNRRPSAIASLSILLSVDGLTLGASSRKKLYRLDCIKSASH